MPLTLAVELVLAMAISIPVILVLRKIGWPSAAGFLIVGAALGENALGWVSGGESVESLAEIGVALLLFTAGLEFSLPRLIAIFGAVTRIGVACGLAVVAVALGLFTEQLGFETALFLGLACALSSTALGLKLLGDSNDLATPHGRLTVGVLLLQDVAVIPLLFALPLLAGIGGDGLSSALVLSGKALALVGGVLGVGHYIFPAVAGHVARKGGRELFLLLVVCVAFGASLLAHQLGLPLALGAFVAGLAIAESQYRHQVLSEILPFRDAFNALFFLSIGMLFNVQLVVQEWSTVTSLLALLIVVKGGSLTLATLWVTRSMRTALLVGSGLMQVGEFSFVLAGGAVDVGLLSPEHFQVLLAVAVLSMLVTPLPFRLLASTAKFSRTSGSVDGPKPESDPETPRVLIAGYGFAGKQVAFALEASGVPYHVIEMNPLSVRQAQALGVPISFGDVGRADAMLAAGLKHAEIFVLAISDLDSTRRGIVLARSLAPNVQIVARTRYFANAAEFRALGAHLVQPEEFATSLSLTRHVLQGVDVDRELVEAWVTRERDEGSSVLGSLQRTAEASTIDRAA